jgi:YebC/PmpR family DNA-binding regulatory protein
MGRAFEFRKGRKLKRWASMSKTFARISKNIMMAVKEGGPNPDTNYRLKLEIQNAKQANMPKDNVERAIKKASSNEIQDFKELVYEGYAPHGVAVLVETATDNPTRTVANVRSYFNKVSGSLGTSGSVEFLFEHKCHFKVPGGMDLEEFELEMIDHGVEEIFPDEEDDTVMVYGSFEDFGAISRALDEKGVEILESGLERIPTDTKTLTEDQIPEVEKLIQLLEEDDDVQNVYHTWNES